MVTCHCTLLVPTDYVSTASALPVIMANNINITYRNCTVLPLTS